MHITVQLFFVLLASFFILEGARMATSKHTDLNRYIKNTLIVVLESIGILTLVLLAQMI